MTQYILSHFSLVQIRLVGSVAGVVLAGCLSALSLLHLSKRRRIALLGAPIILSSLVFVAAIAALQVTIK